VLDEIIKGATVVDGTGAPGVVADVGIADGRVVAVGTPRIPGDDDATVVTDGSGLVLAPGFVDPHTHYDAQLLWDPTASPSSVHGVTTVVGGNCGFSLAPLHEGDADYLRRMMARVEGMPLPALEQGVDWKWETFGEFLDRFEGSIAVNAGFLAGHCAIRRYVMGPDAIGGDASPEQIAEMRAELGKALDEGALGFSFTQSSSHSDGDGQPVASRWATPEELVAMSEETGAHPGTTLEGIVQGCLDQFSDEEIELLSNVSAAANRPLNWNVLTVDSREPERVPRQLSAGDRAAEVGGRLVALTMPVQVPMNMSFLNFCGIWLIPGWSDILTAPVPERIERLRDPEIRLKMLELSQSPEAGVFRRLADFGDYRLGDVYAPENQELRGRVVRDIARERERSNFGTLLDIVIADELRTVLWPIPQDSDDSSWDLRREVWNDPRALIGGSDAGAHLDRMCGAPYTTRFLADCLRGRQLISLERAVELITSKPAALFGLRDRGVIREGAIADLVLFDPQTVGADDAALVADLPGDSARLTAGSHGIKRVLVGGVAVVEDGEATGATPGVVLRSGRDTDTVTAR
jgi:N-acyl-D-aspartate/D-glutamate deacylase